MDFILDLQSDLGCGWISFNSGRVLGGLVLFCFGKVLAGFFNF